MRRTIPVVRTNLTGCKTNAFVFATPVAAGANFVARINRFAGIAIPVVAIAGLSGEIISVADFAVPIPRRDVRTGFIRGIDAFFRLFRFAIGTIAVSIFGTGFGL